MYNTGTFCDALYCKVINELLSANTIKLKSSNSLCHREKPRRLEADSATGSWPCDNRRPLSRATGRSDDQRPCSWGLVTVPLRRCWYAYCSPSSPCVQEWQCDALWYTDTDTDVFVLLLAQSKNLTSKRCYMKKGRGANILCKSTPAMLTTSSGGSLPLSV